MTLIEEARERMKECKMGNKNPRWNGGNSDYPNHAEFKRARIKVLKKTKGECEICGDMAKIIHHIDENKSNHSTDNLIAVCYKCHESLHCDDNGVSVRGKPTKFGLKYNMPIKRIASIFGVSYGTIYNWINNYPEKEKWMRERLEELF